jgi:hypothetical protein
LNYREERNGREIYRNDEIELIELSEKLLEKIFEYMRAVVE